ncbi:hypothetical protein GCM10023196_079530 [Actinoallomurus vinaceus]|uniref:Apea-like HEPN domain-containing protein n=1 Tax=Actinoallomurus vinaceus TaxID=1080074 RepID=A0ABP8UPV0_9ACTN
MSTRSVNNWQTLDVHHYFVMNGGIDDQGALRGDAIPMSVEAGYLAELSDLPVDLNMAYWSKGVDSAEGLWQPLETIANLQLPTRFRRSRAGQHSRARTARKIFESLDYFRRSLGFDRWYAVVSLATAFEMLLTSHYAGGITERLKRRVELLLGDPIVAQAVADVYDARSEMVHAGRTPPESLAIHAAQRAYLGCLEQIASKLNGLSRNEIDPMRRITGDI